MKIESTPDVSKVAKPKTGRTEPLLLPAPKETFVPSGKPILMLPAPKDPVPPAEPEAAEPPPQDPCSPLKDENQKRKFKIETLDDDGPGNGGGYSPYTVASPVKLGNKGLLWHPLEEPKEGEPQDCKHILDDDGPGNGGGYFQRPFSTAIDPPFEDDVFRAEGLTGPIDPGKTQEPAPPEAEPAPTEAKPAEPKPAEPQARQASPNTPVLAPTVLEELKHNLNSIFTGATNPLVIKAEVAKINELGRSPEVANLKTPAQFQAKTADFKQRLADGATLEEIRNEVYAVARQAAKVALGKTPFDSQVHGAIPLSQNQIAQMGTGEGKTLTAILPLYLNALEGKGSMLVTVNDYLAKEGYEQNKAAFEVLGLTTGLATKDQNRDEKRAAYNCDVTYISNDTLGFDYLNDRMCTDPNDRVQRPLHAAVVDEFDQVALDEARVPLIIAGATPEDERSSAEQQYRIFHQVVSKLKPIEDFQVDREHHSSFLTELGQDVVANELALMEATDPEKIKVGERLREVLREEGSLIEKIDSAPKLKLSEKLGKLWDKMLRRDTSTPEERSLEEVREEKARLLEEFPGVNLYAEENMWRLRPFQNALDARGLFRKGRDYIVAEVSSPEDETLKTDRNGATAPAKPKLEVQIVDEFKGRTSEGRRYSNGLHQALEVKENVEVHPETRTVASITYPNLLRLFTRLSGMTGTAETSKEEFQKLLGMEVVVCPPNLPSKRVDHPDRIFRTREAKMKALTEEAGKWFDAGVPVLIGSNTVENNKYVSAFLSSQGVYNQPFNTENVKTNTPEENALIAQAGKSGVITAATNMAGRGVDIKPDRCNYKALAIAAAGALDEGKAIVVDVAKPEDAQRLAEWFNLPEDPAQRIPFTVDAPVDNTPGRVQVRVGAQSPVPEGVEHIQASDFPGSKLVVLATERNADRRIDMQLRGRSGRQGAEGETQFFVSLEDDLLQVYGGENTRKLIESLDKDELTGDKSIQKLVDEAQERIQNAYADARFQTAKYDQIANKQRTIVWQFRDTLVNSRPDVPSVEGDKYDLAEKAREWAGEAFTATLLEKLDGKEKPKQKKLDEALDQLAEEIGFRLELDPADKEKPLAERVQAAVDRHYDKMSQTIPNDALSLYVWDTMVKSLDEAWTYQIQDLEDLKQAANLQAYAEKEPFQAYIEMTSKAFDEMWASARLEFTKKLFPEMQKTVEILAKQPK